MANQVTQTGSRPAEHQASVDDLAQRLQQFEGVSEELAHKVASNWKRFLGLVLCVMLGVWLIGEIKNAGERKRADAALKFSAAAQASRILSHPPTEGAKVDLPSVQRALDDNLKALTDRRTPDFYRSSALVYQASDLLRQGKTQEAQQLLNTIEKPAKSKKLDAVEFTAEFAALAAERAKLNADNADLPSIRAELKRLATDSQIANAEALILLARISETPEERAEVMELAMSLKHDRPEFSATLESNLSELGLSDGISN